MYGVALAVLVELETDLAGLHGLHVIGGMVVGAFLGVFFIPLFFVVVQRVFGRARHTEETGDAAGGGRQEGEAHA